MVMLAMLGGGSEGGEDLNIPRMWMKECATEN